jgi:uncharacterized damage-inducible protein DinB
VNTKTMQPERGILLQNALPARMNEHQATKGVIEAIPLDEGECRPDLISKTALELAWHIPVAEHRFFGGIRLASSTSRQSTAGSSAQSAEIIDWYAQAFAEDFDMLAGLSGEQFSR